MNKAYAKLIKRGVNISLYQAWVGIKQRCNNPNNCVYAYYGARGIKVCERWNKFENFAADVGPHPGKGWSIDRINNEGDYEPGNVRWATQSMQMQNSRNRKLTAADVIAIRAEHRPRKNQYTPGVGISDLAAKYGVGHETIRKILLGEKWKIIHP